MIQNDTLGLLRANGGPFLEPSLLFDHPVRKFLKGYTHNPAHIVITETSAGNSPECFFDFAFGIEHVGGKFFFKELSGNSHGEEAGSCLADFSFDKADAGFYLHVCFYLPMPTLPHWAEKTSPSTTQ